MNRTCARSGCPRRAAATLSYSYADRIVWLELLTEEPHPMVHDMCREHAETVNPPLGWELRDLRRTDADLSPAGVAGPVQVRFDLIGA